MMKALQLAALGIFCLLPQLALAQNNSGLAACPNLQTAFEQLQQNSKSQPKRQNKDAADDNDAVSQTYFTKQRTLLKSAIELADICRADRNVLEPVLYTLSRAAYWLHHDTHDREDAKIMLQATSVYLRLANALIAAQPVLLGEPYYDSTFRFNLNGVYNYREIAFNALDLKQEAQATLETHAKQGFCRAQDRLVRQYQQNGQMRQAVTVLEQMLDNPACTSRDSTDADVNIPGIELSKFYAQMNQDDKIEAVLQKQNAVNQKAARKETCGNGPVAGEFKTAYLLAQHVAIHDKEQALGMAQYGLVRAATTRAFDNLEEDLHPSIWQRLKNVWQQSFGHQPTEADFDFIPKLAQQTQQFGNMLDLATRTKIITQATVKALNTCKGGLSNANWIQEFDPAYDPDLE